MPYVGRPTCHVPQAPLGEPLCGIDTFGRPGPTGAVLGAVQEAWQLAEELLLQGFVDALDSTFLVGAYAAVGRTSISSAAAATRIASARKSRPRSTRMASGTAPMGPNGASTMIAARIAARMLSRLGVAVMANPVMAREKQSRNSVARGRTTRRSGINTEIASCVWSACHS